jgi:hypothetical protein
VITHPATLDVSRERAQQVGRLRWFRHGTDITAVARDHGISRATGYRCVEEVVTVLAAHAPDLHEAPHSNSPISSTADRMKVVEITSVAEQYCREIDFAIRGANLRGVIS